MAIIRSGRLLAEGPIEELKRGPAAPATDVRGRGLTPALTGRIGALPGVAGIEAADGRLTVFWKEAPETSSLLRALVDGGAEVDEITARKATFEAAFLKLVKDEGEENASCSAI